MIENKEIMKKVEMLEKSDDLVNEAFNQKTKKLKKELLEKALEIYPENYDAERFLIFLENDKIKVLNNLKKLMKKVEDKLKEEDPEIFEDSSDIGYMIEARPYLRIKYSYIRILIDLCRYKEAKAEAEEMLKLSERDGTGTRYTLIGLYIFFEEFKKAEKIIKKYDEDSLIMLLLEAMMNFKKAEYDKFKECIRQIKMKNIDVIPVLKDKEEFNELMKYGEKADSYSPGSLGEVAVEFQKIKPLVYSIPYFFKMM